MCCAPTSLSAVGNDVGICGYRVVDLKEDGLYEVICVGSRGGGLWEQCESGLCWGWVRCVSSGRRASASVIWTVLSVTQNIVGLLQKGVT